MGCFSFICQKSGKPVLSSSFSGDAVHLFLLENGKVIEHMFGNYDSYGRVFSSFKEENDDSCTNFTSFEWKMEWGDVCDLIFDDDRSNGICAILSTHFVEGDPYPTERSDHDPNQGWGDDLHLLGDCGHVDTTVENSYHKVF